jgi:LuxR family maltose regulon positive regulatory protein
VGVCWLSLDKGDNDPARFWAYFIAALQPIHKGLGATVLAALQSTQPPASEALLTSLLNEIAAIPAPFTLVLDDFHLITNQQVHKGVVFLLDHLPPPMHLIIASRADPPWPLARLRARGEISELRATDLRFTPEEAVAFLNTAMGLELSPEDVAALEERTEGWIVGLQMAAISVQGRRQAPSSDVSTFIQAFTGSHRYILDYLTDEVLLQQPESVRTFLLQTAILDRLTGSLCDAVTGQGNGQEMLEQLEAANLFIIPLDDERQWYRYHHLFADLLRKRLSQTQPDLLPALHRRASEWYEKNRLIAEAVSYALTAGDVELVARLVGGNALAMLEHGELKILQVWLDALPDQVVRSQPWLCVARAWMSAFTGQLDAVEPLLRDAKEATVGWEQSAEGQHIGGHIAAVRACVAIVTGDKLQTAELAREALELLPADDLMTRGWAAMVLGLNLYQSGDIAAADQALSEAVKICRASGDSHVAVLALCNLGAVQMNKGQLVQAADTFRDALRLAEEYADRAGRRLPVSAYAHTCLGALLCQRNDLHAAMSHLREGIELCKQWGEPLRLGGAYLQLADALQTIGDADGALDAIRKAKQAISKLSPWFAARVASVEALIRLKQGDTAAASRWAASHENGLNSYFDVFDYWYGCLVKARVDIAQGRLDEALEMLTQVLKAAETAEGKDCVVGALALQAIALQTQGELDQALIALERALTLAEPEGYVRIFVDEGEPMGQLLRQAADRGIAPEYVGRLLAALMPESGRAPRPGKIPLAEPLSERELEVLRLLRTDLSITEIAQAIYVSVNTVRTHQKSIYGKLQVHSRLEAVRRAQELDLL